VRGTTSCPVTRSGNQKARFVIPDIVRLQSLMSVGLLREFSARMRDAP